MPVCEQPSCSQMEETRGFRMPDQTAGLPKEVGQQEAGSPQLTAEKLSSEPPTFCILVKIATRGEDIWMGRSPEPDGEG